MTKKLLMGIAVTGLIIGTASIGFAATNVRIAAAIGQVHQLNVALNKVTGTTFTPVSDLTGVGMDFGSLVQGTDTVFRSPVFFAVDAPVVSNHATWTVTHTRTDFLLSGGTVNLNNNVNVTFVKVDNATSAETVLTNGFVSYQNSNSKIYSNTDVTNGRLRIYYGIANGGSGDASGVQVIPASQPSGTYTGTVTLTLSP